MKIISTLIKIYRVICSVDEKIILIIALLLDFIFKTIPCIFGITILLLFLIKVTYPLFNRINKKLTNKRKETTILVNQNKNGQYSHCYKQRKILTENEWKNYKKLKELCDKKNLLIFPKVRLLDIIEPINNQWNYQTLLHKVQSKHIDFLLCKPDMTIVAILELDDNSHNKTDRIERDAFVDEILTSVGYKIIRTRNINENTLKPIFEL